MANEKTVEWPGSEPVWNYYANNNEHDGLALIRAKVTSSDDGTSRVTLTGPGIHYSFGEKGARAPWIVVTYKDGKISKVERYSDANTSLTAPPNVKSLSFTQGAGGEILIQAFPKENITIPKDAAVLGVNLRMVGGKPEIDVRRQFVAEGPRKQETYHFAANKEITVQADDRTTVYHADGIGRQEISSDKVKSIYAARFTPPIPIGAPPFGRPGSLKPEESASAEVALRMKDGRLVTNYYPSGRELRDGPPEINSYRYTFKDGAMSIEHEYSFLDHNTYRRRLATETIDCPPPPSPSNSLLSSFSSLWGGNTKSGTQLTPKMVEDLKTHLQLMNAKLKFSGSQEIVAEGADVCALAASVVKNIKARLTPERQ